MQNPTPQQTPKQVQKSAVRPRFTGDCASLSGAEFAFKEAKEDKPAHWHARLFGNVGVDIHLREGLAPPKNGEAFVADVEIKEREVSGRRVYVYLNLYPPTNPFPEFRVSVTRAPLDLSGIGEASRRDKEDFVEHCIDVNGTVTLLKPSS